MVGAPLAAKAKAKGSSPGLAAPRGSFMRSLGFEDESDSDGLRSMGSSASYSCMRASGAAARAANRSVFDDAAFSFASALRLRYSLILLFLDALSDALILRFSASFAQSQCGCRVR